MFPVGFTPPDRAAESVSEDPGAITPPFASAVESDVDALGGLTVSVSHGLVAALLFASPL